MFPEFDYCWISLKFQLPDIESVISGSFVLCLQKNQNARYARPGSKDRRSLLTGLKGGFNARLLLGAGVNHQATSQANKGERT